MASKKKESEGIALLSMYNDEDEEMEDTYEEDEDADPHNKEELGKSDRAVSDSANELTPASVDPFQSSAPVEYLSSPEIDRVPTPIATPNPSPTPPPVLVPQFRSSSPPQQLQPPPSPPPAQPPVMESQRMRRQVLTIVDYAHDETAMSPEAEEGEITSSGHVMFGGDLQTINGNSQEITSGAVQNFTPNSDSMIQRPSEQSEPSQSENTSTMTYAKMESESTGMEETLVVEVEMKEDVDPLDEFLPPAPTTKCSEELQEKINKFLALKKSGKSFNAEVRNRKDYRNPDFLLHAVRYQDIDQIGSCFSKAVFDPHGYDKSDFYDEIELNMKHEMERKEQEKKKSQKVDFVAGGTQPGMLSGAPKTGMQIPVIPNIVATGHHSLSSTADVMMRDSRMSKKSKWDKVDSDRQNPLQTGGQDVISAAATHAVFLSAASAGAGYTAFAQQKRREAEEKRSSDKRRS